MNISKRRAYCGSCRAHRVVAISLLVAALADLSASAQSMHTIPIDDFNEQTGIPGMPNGWSIEYDTTVGEPFGPGKFDASTGEYQLQTTGIVPGPGLAFLASSWDESSDPFFSDGYVRTTIRADSAGTIASLLLRASGSEETGTNAYVFFGTTANVGGPGNGGFLFNKIVNSQNVWTRFIPMSFRVNELWNLEAGAVGDQISMKVWREGDPEPVSPQMRFRDQTLSTGRIGVGSNIHNSPFPGPGQVSAAFDNIEFRFSPHEDPFTLAPYDIYLWESPMPVPQVEGPFFTPGSPEKPDMRGDVSTAGDWPDLRITGQVTDLEGQPIPGLKLDFWQVDDQGSYDNSGGYDLRGHIFTDQEGNYELWTVMPANYESIRTRHMHVKLGGENQGFDSWAYTTQLYFPDPYDNDIDADGAPDKVIEGGVLTDLDAISLEDDFIAEADWIAAGAEFSDMAANILTLNNDPLVDGYFDTSLDFVLPQVFQAPVVPGDYNGNGLVEQGDLDLVLLQWGSDVSALPSEWVNQRPTEGIVDQAALDGVLLNWGSGTAVAASGVPEPGTLVLVVLAIAVAAIARRQKDS